MPVPVLVLDADGWFISAESAAAAAIQDKKSSSPTTVALPDSASDISSLASSSRTSVTTESSSAAVIPAGNFPKVEIPAKGVDPQQLIGKHLLHIRRSVDHPAVFFSFDDGTEYQVLVDGYDPRHGGCELEMSDDIQRTLSKPGKQLIDSQITHCRYTRLSDIASKRGPLAEPTSKRGVYEDERWTVLHDAFTFKIADSPRWHCISAIRAEYERNGACTFRTFDDVYLRPVAAAVNAPRSPVKSKSKFPNPNQPPESPTKSSHTDPFRVPSPTKQNKNKRPKRIVEGSMDVWRNHVKEFLREEALASAEAASS